MVQKYIFLLGAEGVKMQRLFYKLLGIIAIVSITLILFYKANYFYFLGVCILLSILFKFIEIMRKTSWSCTRGCKHFKGVGSIPNSIN